MKTDLATVIANARTDASVLRRAGHESEANLIERLCTDVENAAEEYMTFAGETDAALFSGLRARRLQGMFPALAARGHAKKSGRARMYRLCALPRRASTQEAFDAGVEAARKSA